MRRKLPIIYAIACVLSMLAGLVLVFLFSFRTGLWQCIAALVGFAVSLLLAPAVHECGHVLFAKRKDMAIFYVKFFCFAISVENGKRRVRLVSPFSADETQAIPKSSGNMQNRALAYTLGGLYASGVLLSVLLFLALILTLAGVSAYAVWSLIPYVAYLFLLNVFPIEYPDGKTDALIYCNLKKGCDAEKTMLAAMEIQGQVHAGKTFGEIDEKLYFDLPQLCEDDKLFAVILELRYRYYIEKANFEKAADCLNRLVQAQEYLTVEEIEKVAAELTYMHALNGDYERAEESGKLCQNYLKESNPTAKRILAAYSAAFGKTDAAQVLIAQAQEVMKNERMLGVRRFEEKLLSRIYLV